MGLFRIFTGCVRAPVFFYRDIFTRADRAIIAQADAFDGRDGAVGSAASGGVARSADIEGAIRSASSHKVSQ
jgi:hypothetical protein